MLLVIFDLWRLQSCAKISSFLFFFFYFFFYFSLSAANTITAAAKPLYIFEK